MPEAFDIIYADFPWEYHVYNNETGSGRSAQKHYDTNNPKQFYDLPMLDLCSRSSLLMLWATHPNLMQVQPLVDAWNEKAEFKYQRFEYKTVIFDWAKLNKGWRKTAQNILAKGVTDAALDELIVRIFANGTGFYSMANEEQVLVYGRGGLGNAVERMDRTVRSFQAHPIGGHSHKPDAFNALINQIFPRARCLELFARRHYPDPRWTCMGNELSGNDIHLDIDRYLHPIEEEITWFRSRSMVDNPDLNPFIGWTSIEDAAPNGRATALQALVAAA